MKRRSRFYTVLGVTAGGSVFSAALICGVLSASRAEQPTKRALLKTSAESAPDPASEIAPPAPPTNSDGELNRISQQEKAILGSDKKTIAGLSAQIEILQMQQDKLVEELLKYRRLARESKGGGEPDTPAFTDEPQQAMPKGATKREKELNIELQQERNRGVKLEKEIADLERRLSVGEGKQRTATDKKVEELEDELKEERAHEAKLEKDISELEERLARAKENVTRATGMEEQLQEKNARITELEAELEDAKKGSSDAVSLRAELEKSKHQIAELQTTIHDQSQLVDGIPALRRQLQEAKNQLLMKQTEMQVLAKAGSASPAVPPAPPKLQVNDVAKQKILDEVMERSGRMAGEETVKGKPSNDVLIVEVRAPKGNLRSGPGNEHAPIMQVQRGTRLTVEQREGDWYRVIAPTGSRAYITADVVAPVRPDGSGGSASARRPAKQVIRAMNDESLEPFGEVQKEGPAAAAVAAPRDDADRAFQQLQKGVRRTDAPVAPEQE